MFQITIPFLYLLSALAFGASRFPRFEAEARRLLAVAFTAGSIGIAVNTVVFVGVLRAPSGLDLSMANAIALIGLQLVLIGLIGAFEARLRGMTAGLFLLGAITSVALLGKEDAEAVAQMSWQIQGHVLISIFAYGLLTAGAIVAVYALILDHRLRSGQFAGGNPLFAPLETTETMLYGVTAAGFAGLLLAVVTGFAFVDNLFAQHLVHKTALSLLALLLFGILLAGRMFAGWRGRRAVYLYLWGFGILCLAYFGSRFILEELLGRSWG